MAWDAIEAIRSYLCRHTEHNILRSARCWSVVFALVEEGLSTNTLPVWIELNSLTEKVHKHLNVARSAFLNHAPFLPQQLLIDSSLATLKEIATHLEQGGGLKALQIPIRVHLNGSWKPILEQARCNDQKPTQADHFTALILTLELHLAREQLRRRWERQVEILGGPQLPID